MVLSVVPLVAYLLVTSGSGTASGVLDLLPFMALLVSGTTLLPLAAAKTSAVRYVVTAVMTCVAVMSGLLPILTNGEQGFAIFLVPVAAVVLAVVVRVSPSLMEHRWSASRETTELFPASIGDRLAALAIDALVFLVIFGLPLKYLKDSGRQSACLALAIMAGTTYLAAAVHWSQRTVGHRLMGLAVLSEDIRGPVSLPRSIGRGLVVAIEVVGGVLLLLAPIVAAELFVAAWYGGRTITDRVFGTLVVARPTAPEMDAAPSGD